MEPFAQRLKQHADHIANVGPHCDSEETTKQALILPLLDILGYSPYDPLKVRAEYQADLPGVKKGERVDYALFSEGRPVMFVEAKGYKENLSNHAPQLARYFNATPGVRVCAITNGQEWRFFTDLQHDNVMDDDPFLVIQFPEIQESHIQELEKFRFGVLDTDRVRSVAENLTYLSKFKAVVETSLKDIDQDFVRYVASKATPQLRLTAKVIEATTPLIKRAVAETLVEMVAGGLNIQPSPLREAKPAADEGATPESSEVDDLFEVDPNNPKIITTPDERRLLAVTRRLLEGRVEADSIVAKDTETYYAILLKGKAHRWLVRYYANRKQPLLNFNIGMDEQRRKEVERAGLEIGAGDAVVLMDPDDIMRIPGLLYDALIFCQNDENFRRPRGGAASAEEG